MLRVATLNIWNRLGPWDQRLLAIRSHLRAVDADVVALQEVLRARPGVEGPDQAAEIADGFGYHCAYGSTREEPIQFGNAILSRWPITRSELLPLPNVGTDERRCIVFAEIEAPFGALPVFVTHLNWKLHEGHVREEQVRYLADQVQRLAPISGFPPIVMGDFNAEPDSDEMRFLRGLTSLRGKSAYFADCFGLVGKGESMTFSPETNRFAWHTYEPERRIDYVLVRGPDAQGRGKPLSARRAFDTPVDGVLPSDHYGVVAELSTTAEEIPKCP